jgi:hypothetical protein
MSLYKMKPEYSKQLWYDSKVVYRLVKIHQNRYISGFGTDCTWENIITGKLTNNWDNVMRPLTKLEVREFNLNQII